MWAFWYGPLLGQSAGAGAVNGSLAGTIDPVTLSATGTLTIQGSLAQTIAPVTLAASGNLPINGAVSATVDPVTLVATGTGVLAAINGTLGQTIDPVTLAATATISQPPITGKKPGAFRKLRINHIFLRDDEPIKELPKPTKKRVQAVQKAVLAEAAGLLGHTVPPRAQGQVRSEIKRAYTPRVTPEHLEELLAEILRLAVQRANDEIEAEDEEMLLMAI